jgi:hypothetical protein
MTAPLFIVIILFFLILISYWLGHSLRSQVLLKNPNKAQEDLGTINGTLLGLLGLLLAFTFSMSSSRFDTRRKVVIEEANDIGTVILRTDFFPDSVRQALRAHLKEYVEERIGYFEAGIDLDKVREHAAKSNKISTKVWSIVTEYARKDPTTTRTSELVPALNAMIDITTTRQAALDATIPDSILYFLFILCFCSAFLLGYDNKFSIDWIILLGFAIMLSMTVYTIIDLDRPRTGLIDTSGPNKKMIELREMF